MHWIFSLYVAFLFFILTPAILVRLPPKAGKFTVAGFHAVVFALVLHFTGKIVWNFSRGLEGFQEGLNQTQALATGSSTKKGGIAWEHCKENKGAITAGTCVISNKMKFKYKPNTNGDWAPLAYDTCKDNSTKSKCEL